MTVPPIDRLAHVLVRHSLDVQPGERVLLVGGRATLPLMRRIDRVVRASGGTTLPFGAAIDTRPVTLFPDGAALRNSHACIFLEPSPALPRRALLVQGGAEESLLRQFLERTSARDLRWVVTVHPCQGDARRLGMSLTDWRAFVWSACRVDQPGAPRAWRRIAEAQQRLVDRLERASELRFSAQEGTDLTVQIRGRRWVNSHGQRNLPDGEVFTAPLQDGVNGVVRFVDQSEFAGRVLGQVSMRFHQGRVVEATAEKEQGLLDRLLAVDRGASVVGEIALGCNYEITRPIGHALFDEKIGGTFHLALGSSYPETGGTNQSLLHWDLVCDLRKGGLVKADGEVISREGRFSCPDWPQPD